MKAERSRPDCLDGFVLRPGTPPDQIAYDPCGRCAGTGRTHLFVYESWSTGPPRRTNNPPEAAVEE